MKTNLKHLLKVLKIDLTILILILLPLAAFTLITSKGEVLGIQSFVVLTGSMNPTIPPGSIIFTQKLSNYRAGDIIAFKKGVNNVTHRIQVIKQEKGQTLYFTQGDANNTLDSEPVLQKDILGKSVMKANYIGKLVISLKTPLGFFGLIIIPALLLILIELLSIKKEIEKNVRKKVLEEVIRKNAFV